MTSSFNPSNIFGYYAPLYEERGLPVVPVVSGTKRAAVKEWQRAAELGVKARRGWIDRFSDQSIGLLAGATLTTGRRLCFIDVDHDGFVAFVTAVIGSVVCAKFGSKGLTIFAQASPETRSAKLKPKSGKGFAVEIFADSGMTVLPPSPHPSGVAYTWRSKELLGLEHSELPILDAERFGILSAVARNPCAWEIAGGGATTKGHDLMLSLTSSGIAGLTDDLDWLADCLNALFHQDYAGNTRSETLGMLRSAKTKRLGAHQTSLPATYETGDEGPIPLGFTKEGLYALRDQIRNIIVIASAPQLLSIQYQLGLCGSDFWCERFPKRGGFDSMAVGEALIAACKRKGPFNPLTVRGRGIWREGDQIVVNLGDRISPDAKYLYLCFEPIHFNATADFDVHRHLGFLQMFNWRNPQDAMLLLGWLALAPVCGVLNWRPHCFVYGPPRCGKTTIHTLAARLLHPLVISTDGQSTEAGIRQTLGPDSLPIIIDEFESDQSGTGLRGVLRLARSASSAENPVLRGTPEGKAMQFSLRTSFFFCAVNPAHMSQADQTRILLLEMQMHKSDPSVACSIIEEESYFGSLGSAWCGYMVSLAELIAPALEIFEKVMPSSDRRHRQNMATLLAATFVALNRRVPSPTEAEAVAIEYTPTIDLHAEEAQRDDARECLDYLFSHVVDDYPLGHWLAKELARGTSSRGMNSGDSRRIVRTYDMIIRSSGDQPGLLIRNGSPAIRRVFQNTKWAEGAWQRALRKLNGGFVPRDPVHFGGSAGKSRCVGVPLDMIPNSLDAPEFDVDF